MADALITVAGVTVTAGVKSITVRWTVNIASCLPYLALAVFEVWAATSNNRTLASKVGDTTDLSFTHQGLLIGVARYYWVRAKDASGQYSDFYPLSATSGVAGTPTSTGTNSVGSDELADNSVGTSHLKTDAVTATKINVTSLDAISATLGNVAVNGTLLINGTVATGKYANLSVITSKVADGAITPVSIDEDNNGGTTDVLSGGNWLTVGEASGGHGAIKKTVTVGPYGVMVSGTLTYDSGLSGADLSLSIWFKKGTGSSFSGAVQITPEVTNPSVSGQDYSVGLYHFPGTGSATYWLRWKHNNGSPRTMDYDYAAITTAVPQK